MDYQPTGQMPNPPMNPTPVMTPMPKSDSKIVWYTVVLVVVIAAAAWYYYRNQPAPTTTTAPAVTVDQLQTAPLTSGNTTADISNDLKAIPDDTAALNHDAAASAQTVSGF